MFYVKCARLLNRKIKRYTFPFELYSETIVVILILSHRHIGNTWRRVCPHDKQYVYPHARYVNMDMDLISDTRI